jgi:hypothetical protein
MLIEVAVTHPTQAGGERSREVVTNKPDRTVEKQNIEMKEERSRNACKSEAEWIEPTPESQNCIYAERLLRVFLAAGEAVGLVARELAFC